MNRLKEKVAPNGAAQKPEKKGEMKEVVDRLRAESEVESKQSRTAGYEAGEKWAKKYGKPSQLRRLFTAVFTGQGASGDVDLFIGGMTEGTYAQEVYAVITGEQRADTDDAPGPLVGALESMKDDSDFAAGFIEGATDVWEAVRSEL